MLCLDVYQRCLHLTVALTKRTASLKAQLHTRIQHAAARIEAAAHAIAATQVELKIKAVRIKQAERQMTKMQAVHTLQMKRLIKKDLVHLSRKDSIRTKLDASQSIALKLQAENEDLDEKVVTLEAAIGSLLGQCEAAIESHANSVQRLLGEHQSMRKVDFEVETVEDLHAIMEDFRYVLSHHTPERRFALKSKHLTLSTLQPAHLTAMSEIMVGYLPMKLLPVNVTLHKRLYNKVVRRATVPLMPIAKLTPREQLEYDALGASSDSSSDGADENDQSEEEDVSSTTENLAVVPKASHGSAPEPAKVPRIWAPSGRKASLPSVRLEPLARKYLAQQTNPPEYTQLATPSVPVSVRRQLDDVTTQYQVEAADALAQQLQAEMSAKRALIESLEAIATSDAKLVRDSRDRRASLDTVLSKARVTPTTRQGKELVTSNAALVLAIADIEASIATLQATIQSSRSKPAARLAQRRLSVSAEAFETDADVARLVQQFELLLRHTLPKSALHSIKAKRILMALEAIDETSLQAIEITLGDYLPFQLPLAPTTSKKKTSLRHPDDDEDETYFSKYEDNTAKIRRHLQAAGSTTPAPDGSAETSPRTTSGQSTSASAETTQTKRLSVRFDVAMPALTSNSLSSSERPKSPRLFPEGLPKDGLTKSPRGNDATKLASSVSTSALPTAESLSPPRLSTSSSVDALVVKFTSRLRQSSIKTKEGLPTTHRRLPSARHNSLLVATPVAHASKPSSPSRSSKAKDLGGSTGVLLDAPKLVTTDQLLPIDETSTVLKTELKAKSSLKSGDAPSQTTESDTPGPKETPAPMRRTPTPKLETLMRRQVQAAAVAFDSVDTCSGSKAKDLFTKSDAKVPEVASRLRRASVSVTSLAPSSSSTTTSSSVKAPRDLSAHLGEQAIARRTEMSRMNDFERIALADDRLKTDVGFS
ncbi:hypothetical protein SDRG_07093 [Saprolegnia diclina VS20]|uniref:Uncharacterized protein n=1 Tax=Saprolegnia diclina (strain VS20) TaxID=1156394 RepID=T0RYC2_SAPDV|nr:hypothetical protein SDRG_07093 [Saprolegnia diclina VS20]EQC35382.1 hypothetical protein SDRG_07093 [Saprolegnia diclina VS20]|eukprot:XP_008611132.1 hypothetical protein SDRG_07093 [Saprolegnia diclina VS20]